MKAYRYQLALLAIIGYFLLFYFSRINLLYIESSGDNYGYELLAETVFSEHPFKINFKIDFYDELPIFHHERVFPPMHPLFLAVNHLLFGKGMLVNFFTTSVIGVMCVLPVYFIGKLLAGKRVGILAALVTMLFPTLRDTAVLGMSEPLFTFFSLWSLYYLLSYHQKGRDKQLILAGVFTGFAYLTRASGVAMIATGILLVLFDTSLQNLKSKGLKILLFLVTVILVASPWLIRNYQVFGDPFYYVGRFTSGLKPGALHGSLNKPTLWKYLKEATLPQIVNRYTKNLLVRAKMLFDETGIFCLLMLYGLFVGYLRERKYLVLWIYIIMVFLMLLVAHALHGRYLISLFPVVGILGVIAGLRFYQSKHYDSLKDIFKDNFFRQAFLLITVAGIIFLSFQSFTHKQRASDYSQLFPQIGKWFDENTSPDTIIMGDPAPSIYYYTRRPLVMFPRSVTPRGLQLIMDIYKVEYIIVLYQFQLKCLPMNNLTMVKKISYQHDGIERPALILKRS